MNYAPYDLQTQPKGPKQNAEGRDFEIPASPEEVPQVEYPSREEPGHFYADEQERVANEIDQSDEQLDAEREVESGVEAAGDNNVPMHVDDGFNGLAANSGPGLRH